jgi:hypothetical protein
MDPRALPGHQGQRPVLAFGGDHLDSAVHHHLPDAQDLRVSEPRMAATATEEHFMQTWPIVKLWYGLLIGAAASWGVRPFLQRILPADHPRAVDSNLLLSPCDGIS